MPRPLDPLLAGRIAQYSTFPVWMAFIDFPSNAKRLSSTAHDITWKLNTWDGVGLRVSDIDENNPDARAYLEIPNEDNIVTDYLNADGIEHPVSIYRTWAASIDQTTYGDDEVIEVFTGVLAGAPSLGLLARLEVISTNAARLFPFLRIGPPTNTVCWPSDHDVSWNRKTIKVVD